VQGWDGYESFGCNRLQFDTAPTGIPLAVCVNLFLPTEGKKRSLSLYFTTHSENNDGVLPP
jgi:hypothetical protein